MVVTKDYRIIETNQNRTIARDNSVFSICIYSKSRKYETAGHGVLKMICPEARNVICYDLHTITRLSSGCINYLVNLRLYLTTSW